MPESRRAARAVRRLAFAVVCSLSASGLRAQTAARPPRPADAAAILRAVDEDVRRSPLSADCAQGLRRDEDASARDLDAHEEFLPLGARRFLLRWDCATGAYNVKSLIFAVDENLAPAARRAPRLVVFPRPNADRPRRRRPFAFYRDFDARAAVLYNLDKMLGDGSGGFYAEYAIDRKTFVPSLKFAIEKTDADHADGYNFERGRRPRGKGWRAYRPAAPARGCLASPAELKTADDASALCSASTADAPEK